MVSSAERLELNPVHGDADGSLKFTPLGSPRVVGVTGDNSGDYGIAKRPSFGMTDTPLTGNLANAEGSKSVTPQQLTELANKIRAEMPRSGVQVHF